MREPSAKGRRKANNNNGAQQEEEEEKSNSSSVGSGVPGPAEKVYIFNCPLGSAQAFTVTFLVRNLFED